MIQVGLILSSCNLFYMTTQYAYLRINKLEGDIQILSSCNLLYMMTQYTYLRNNKMKGDTFCHFERQYRKIECFSMLMSNKVMNVAITPQMILEHTKVWVLIRVCSTKRVNHSFFIQIHHFLWFSIETPIHRQNTVDIFSILIFMGMGKSTRNLMDHSVQV